MITSWTLNLKYIYMHSENGHQCFSKEIFTPLWHMPIHLNKRFCTSVNYWQSKYLVGWIHQEKCLKLKNLFLSYTTFKYNWNRPLGGSIELVILTLQIKDSRLFWHQMPWFLKDFTGLDYYDLLYGALNRIYTQCDFWFCCYFLFLLFISKR